MENNTNKSSVSRKKYGSKQRKSNSNITISFSKSKRNSKDQGIHTPKLNKSKQEIQSGKKGQSMLLHSKDYKKEYESVAVFLDDYQRILDDKVKALQTKWTSVQILQKNLECSTINTSQCDGNFQQPKNIENLLQIENNFYIQKITELQKALRIKEQQCKQARKLVYQTKANTSHEHVIAQNLRLKQENTIIERQNRVLKNKLKEAKIL